MSGVTLITEPQGLAGIDEEWRHLAEERGNPFVTPEWYVSTLSGAQPCVAVVKGGEGSITGVLPLSAARWRGLKALRFGGHLLGDCFHPVAALGDEVEVATACLPALGKAEMGGLVIDKCADDSGWLEQAYGDGRRPMRFRRTSVAQLPGIDLAGLDWDGYLAGRSSNLRQRVRRMERKLIREHAMTVRVTSTTAELEQDFAVLFALHDARRAELGGSSLDSPARRAELLDFCRASLDRGWLRLRTMVCDGAPVASFLGWSLGGRYCFYQSGFDPSWGNRSVGLVHLALTIRDAIDEGAAEFDLLLGAEDYKLRFADRSREVFTGPVTRGFGPAAGMANAEVFARRARRGARRAFGRVAK